MSPSERQVAEDAVRASCAQWGDEILNRILARVRDLPDTEDGSAFAASVGAIAASTLREHIVRERAALTDFIVGIKAMNAAYPHGAIGMH